MFISNSQLFRMIFFWLLVSIPILILANCHLRCGQHQTETLTKFYFAGACVRSKMNLIAYTNARSLAECKEVANRKKGFAINYIHSEFLYRFAKSDEENCLIYDCPELDVQFSLHMGSVYDYYSAYARPMSDTNITCIPYLGIFKIYKHRLNQSDAEKKCLEEDGYLADVTTDFRSIQLGLSLSQEKVDRAFVGMAKEDGLNMMTTAGWPVSCLNYRAWAPGEPRPKNKCGTLTNKGQWATAPCHYRLSFICELRPSGPLKPCKDIKNRKMKRKCNEIRRRSYPSRSRRPKCGNPKIDDTTFRLPNIINSITNNTNSITNNTSSITNNTNSIENNAKSTNNNTNIITNNSNNVTNIIKNKT